MTTDLRPPPAPATLASMSKLSAMMGRSQAAAYLGVSAAYVQQLRLKGKLGAMKTSLGWLYDPAELERFRVWRADKLAGKHVPELPLPEAVEAEASQESVAVPDVPDAPCI